MPPHGKSLNRDRFDRARNEPVKYLNEQLASSQLIDRFTDWRDFLSSDLVSLLSERMRHLEVAAGKFIGSIYSEPSEGGRGGDIYYFGVCKGDVISRLAIADVTGHGESVSEVSQYVYELLRSHI